MVHYAGDATSTGLVGELNAAATGSRKQPAESVELRRLLAQLDRRLALLESLELAPPAAAVRSTASDQPTAEQLVLNRDSEVIHRTSPDADPADRHTYCGW